MLEWGGILHFKQCPVRSHCNLQRQKQVHLTGLSCLSFCVLPGNAPVTSHAKKAGFHRLEMVAPQCLTELALHWDFAAPAKIIIHRSCNSCLFVAYLQALQQLFSCDYSSLIILDIDRRRCELQFEEKRQENMVKKTKGVNRLCKMTQIIGSTWTYSYQSHAAGDIYFHRIGDFLFYPNFGPGLSSFQKEGT